MGRLIFILAVIAVVYLLLRSYSRQQSPKQDAPAQSEEMVRCVHCGVHFPRSEGILAGGNFYCCDEHRREHEAK